jgi:hypothetical protein
MSNDLTKNNSGLFMLKPEIVDKITLGEGSKFECIATRVIPCDGDSLLFSAIIEEIIVLRKQIQELKSEKV